MILNGPNVERAEEDPKKELVRLVLRSKFVSGRSNPQFPSPSLTRACVTMLIDKILHDLLYGDQCSIRAVMRDIEHQASPLSQNLHKHLKP